jgi:rRNA maturation endonuclease Nob1
LDPGTWVRADNDEPLNVPNLAAHVADAFVKWGNDCIRCEGNFTPNDRCDSRGGRNFIPVYVTKADAQRWARM